MMISSSSVKPFAQTPFGMGSETKPGTGGMSGLLQPAPAPSVTVPPWEGRSIATQKLRLVEFSAFMESQRDPDTVRDFVCFFCYNFSFFLFLSVFYFDFDVSFVNIISLLKI